LISLGRCYLKGKGVQKSTLKAIELFKLAKKQKPFASSAHYYLANCYLLENAENTKNKDIEKAIKHLKLIDGINFHEFPEQWKSIFQTKIDEEQGEGY
jgi:TPR repeat protein